MEALTQYLINDSLSFSLSLFLILLPMLQVITENIMKLWKNPKHFKNQTKQN